MASPLFPLTLAFCLGILVSPRLATPLFHLLGAAAFLLLATWWAHRFDKPKLFFGISMLFFVFVGLICPPLHQASYSRHHLRNLVRAGKLDLAEPCRITGICSKGSIPKGIGEQIELAVERVENRFQVFATEGKVRLALYYSKDEPPPEPLQPGERVEVLANLRLPRNFNNPGQFDYVSYLERQDVVLVGTIKNPLLVARLASGQGSFLSRRVQHLRALMLTHLDSAFAGKGDVPGILKALLLGDRSSLSPAVEDCFQATGLYHVLVISGQHVAIIAAFLFGLLRLVRLPLGATAVLAASGLAFYAALTEGQPSVVRATVMACVFLLVLCLDRDRSLLNSLSLSAWSLLLLDPFWVFDPGFQLSFLAVLAIALVAVPLLQQLTQPWRHALRQLENVALDSRCPATLADFRIWLRLKVSSLQATLPWDRWKLCARLALVPFQLLVFLAELLVVSLSIQVAFVALMVLFFHRVSLVSPFLNLLAVPLVGLLVPLGFLALLGGLLGLPLMALLSAFCALLVNALLQLAQYFSNPNWGNFRLPAPPGWICLLYFLCLALALVPVRWLRWPSIGFAAAALFLLLTQPFPPRTPVGLLQLTAIDVRQGDSLLLSFPDRSNLLVDGGGLLGRTFGEHFAEDSFDVGEEVVSPFLWSLGVKRVDALVLTHAHHDHMSGLHALMENFSVGELWVGENPLVPDYVNLLKRALRHNVRVRSFSSGDSVDFHSSRIEFLNPAIGTKAGKAPSNNDSLAFRLQFGERSFLMTGDIERRIETEMLQRRAVLDCDVLKVAHHGSRSSSLPVFLDQASAIIALISVAEHSPFGHPHTDVLNRLRERGIGVFRTDRHGSIRVTTDGRQLETDYFGQREELTQYRGN